MLQTWIVRSRVHPFEAVKTGGDSSVCGDCPLRPANAEKGAARCYVRTANAPAQVYKALPGYDRVTVAEGVALVEESGLPLRLGSYGDPAAVPADVIGAFADAAGKRRTGYTHQWRTADLQETCMASVGSESEAREAQSRGYRTFRVRQASEPLLESEIVCPASAEAGKRTTCSECRLCNGKAGPHDRRKNIAIIDHGPTAPRVRKGE